MNQGDYIDTSVNGQLRSLHHRVDAAMKLAGDAAERDAKLLDKIAATEVRLAALEAKQGEGTQPQPPQGKDGAFPCASPRPFRVGDRVKRAPGYGERGDGPGTVRDLVIGGCDVAWDRGGTSLIMDEALVLVAPAPEPPPETGEENTKPHDEIENERYQGVCDHFKVPHGRLIPFVHKVLAERDAAIRERDLARRMYAHLNREVRGIIPAPAPPDWSGPDA